jgi:hypothetical protein
LRGKKIQDLKVSDNHAILKNVGAEDFLNNDANAETEATIQETDNKFTK